MQEPPEFDRRAQQTGWKVLSHVCSPVEHTWYISLLSGIANAIVSHARRLMMAQTHLLASGDIAAAFVVANTGKQLVEFDGDPFCQQKVSGASTVL